MVPLKKAIHYFHKKVRPSLKFQETTMQRNLAGERTAIVWNPERCATGRNHPWSVRMRSSAPPEREWAPSNVPSAPLSICTIQNRWCHSAEAVTPPFRVWSVVGICTALRLAADSGTPRYPQNGSWVRPNGNVDCDLFDFTEGRFFLLSFSLILSLAASFTLLPPPINRALSPASVLAYRLLSFYLIRRHPTAASDPLPL